MSQRSSADTLLFVGAKPTAETSETVQGVMDGDVATPEEALENAYQRIRRASTSRPASANTLTSPNRRSEICK